MLERTEIRQNIRTAVDAVADRIWSMQIPSYPMIASEGHDYARIRVRMLFKALHGDSISKQVTRHIRLMELRGMPIEPDAIY